MQKKFGIAVVAAIQVAGQKQQARPGVRKTSRSRMVLSRPIAGAA